MRIFDKNKRLHHSQKTINYFMKNEYDYYSNNNIREFEFNGKKYKSLYRRLNVQLLITKKCPFNCKFCIEKINPVGLEEQDEETSINNLKSILNTLVAANMEPTVSITGGEPMLYVDYVSKVTKMLDELEIKYNINTSGLITDKTKKFLPNIKRINLSVHHFDSDINSNIFGAKRNDYYNNKTFKNATIQTVLTKPNFDYLIKFLNSFNQKRFSIRMLCDTEEIETPEWFELMETINNDNNFEFIQQKIGDYYWFEEYKYKDKIIRFSYASLKQLAYYKNVIENKDNPFVRAVVVFPNGNIEFDWISN